MLKDLVEVVPTISPSGEVLVQEHLGRSTYLLNTGGDSSLSLDVKGLYLLYELFFPLALKQIGDLHKEAHNESRASSHCLYYSIILGGVAHVCVITAYYLMNDHAGSGR